MQVDPSFWHGQGLDPARYALIPRTLTFLRRGERILLLRMTRGEWAGRYNAVGGHVERGEDPRSAAVREVREETGLEPQDLRLCGVVAVDREPRLGIGLYIYVGDSTQGEPRAGAEGGLAWFTPEEIPHLPLVEDLPYLLPQALAAHSRGTAFSAAYRKTADGRLEITLVE